MDEEGDAEKAGMLEDRSGGKEGDGNSCRLLVALVGFPVCCVSPSWCGEHHVVALLHALFWIQEPCAM